MSALYDYIDFSDTSEALSAMTNIGNLHFI